MFPFLPYEIDGEPSIVASYLCTPLVNFPIAALEPGSEIEGTTIAEFGNRNRQIDMIPPTADSTSRPAARRTRSRRAFRCRWTTACCSAHSG